MKNLQKFIGSGLYTIAEASMYARLKESLLRRWIFGDTRRAVFDPQFGSQEKLVSFLDLVQTLAIREIRLMHRVPLPKFRQAIREARKEYKVDYPFAREHFTYLLGKELVIKLADDKYVEVSGRHARQPLITGIVESYLQDLTFSGSGLAASYNIFTSQDQVSIVMNPQRRFGEPLLPSGYSAKCIWDAIKAEGGIENAARAYGISKEEASAAYKLFECVWLDTAFFLWRFGT
jgi:hypothetical protein